MPLWLKILLTFRSWLSRLVGLFTRYPWQFLCLGLVLASWQLWKRGDRYRDKLAAVHVAQHDAGIAQGAVNHEPARKAAAIAEKSDAETPAYYAAVRSAADAHAVRMRRQESAPSAADLPRTDPAVESVHGSDPAADLVCRPPVEDAQIVYAAGRAAEMHQEALDLIAAGTAVAAAPTDGAAIDPAAQTAP